MPDSNNRILELGCGRTKAPGAIGVDFNFDATAADVICDLNRPLPFADSTFAQVRAVQVVEHLESVMELGFRNAPGHAAGRVHLPRHASLL